MIIQDPQRLLPIQTRESWNLPGMVLEVPSHGIPLHPKSLDRLSATVASAKSVVVLQPILPVTSELGLPPYLPLAYLYPQELSDIWNPIRQEFEGTKPRYLLNLIPFKIISETDTDEQLHYFAEQYGKSVKPSYVRVVVGNTCNLKCVMCPYHSPLIKPTHTTDFFTGNKAMSWNMMERLAQECGEARIAIFIGNVEEPLLHPKLVDFIRLCRQQGVPRVHMTTNGQLLDKGRAKALLEAGLTSIDVSIDAAEPKTYLQVRGGDLMRVESNVVNLLQLRAQLGIPCEVRTSFVRNQNISFEEEQKFRERWLTKVDGVFILNQAQYQQNNMRLSKSNDHVQNATQHYIQKAQGRWACLFPFTEIAVLPDGRIYYCIETLFRLGFDTSIETLGDYNQQTLREIWSGHLFQQLRRDLILNHLEKRTACKNCDMWMSQVIDRSSRDTVQVTTTTVTEIYQRVNFKSI